MMSVAREDGRNVTKTVIFMTSVTFPNARHMQRSIASNSNTHTHLCAHGLTPLSDRCLGDIEAGSGGSVDVADIFP